jgi:hypothetical protein
MNKIKIEGEWIRANPKNKLFIDGVEIKGVRNLSIEMGLGKVPVVKIELVGYVEIQDELFAEVEEN